MTRIGKLLLVAPAVLLALSACGGKKAAAPDVAPVPGRVLLSVTASRPAGTLDSLPDLSWTLSGATGLSLVVRAQGPGASAPGVGFAGVRVASGPIRYLAADGTWSDTEVAYATAAGASGVIKPAAPLRLEGEWRFDVVARDSAGDLQALAMAPVVLTASPAVRVTLSQRFAAAGDAVEGAVVLARGGASTPVKLLAWWQGPGGAVVQLPEGAPLAFDGPSSDLRLPVLARRLDGVAPGAWSLVARLFDGTTGAPLAYGEQTLQVCATISPVTGTVRGAAGAALGAGASLAEVQALSIDRQVKVNGPVGAGGDFSLALDPGDWAVSALVVDGAGVHRVPVRGIQVGCSAAAPLILDAAPPVALSIRSAWLGVPVASEPLARLAAPAPTAPPEQVQIPFFGSQSKFTDGVLGPDGLAVGMEVVASQLFTATGHGLSFNTIGTLKGVAQLSALQQALGTDSTTTDRTLNAMAGGHISAGMTATKVTDTQVMLTLTIADGQGNPIRRLQRTVTAGTIYDGFVAIAQEAAGGSPSLLDAVRAVADFPQNPVVSLTAAFGSVLPSSQQTVKVHLQDSHGNTYPGRKVHLERAAVAFPGDPMVLTDAGGDATFSVQLGVADREESVMGAYYNRVGKRFTSNSYLYAVQRAQTGQLQIATTVPVFRPGASAAVQVTSRDTVTGAPQAGKAIAVSADLGGTQQTATAITDSAGVAGVSLTAGTAVGLGQVVAVGSTASPPPPDAGRATENVVVSSPAALNLSGPTGTVLPGAQVPVSGSLQLDGLPMPGTTVTLSSAGAGGTLSATTATVDATGGFSATFQPPPAGTGAATVTASVEVEGQQVTRGVGVSWADGVKKIALTCPGPVNLGDICTVNPDGTGLTNLTNGVSTDSQEPTWSRDRSKIAFRCRLTDPGFCTMNPDGTGLVKVISMPQQHLSKPTWSPDGTRLAGFYFEFPNTNTVAIFNAADGSGLQILPNPICMISDPAWSPDGLRFAVRGSSPASGTCADLSFEDGIWVMDADGANLTRITTGAGGWRVPAWSPDGSQIACTHNDASGVGVWVMNADGSGLTRLAEGSAPTWSPDGTQIAYVHFDVATNQNDVLTISSSGGAPTVILSGQGSQPAW